MRVIGEAVQMTDVLEQQLTRWVEAGLLSRGQADDIARFEGDTPADGDRRGVAAEAVGYVGAGLAFGALGLLLAEWWQDIVVAGRISLAAVATLLVASAALALREGQSEPMRRLTSVLTAATVLGAAWTAYLVVADALSFAQRDVALWVGVVAFVAAAASHLVRPRLLGQLVLLAATMLLLGAGLARPALPPQPVWIAVSYWGLGAVWALLGLGGVLRPRRVAVGAGGALSLVAVQIGGFGDARLSTLLLGVASAVVLVVLAVAIRDTLVLLVGALGLFVLVPQLTFEVFGDAVGAPAALLLSGVVLVVLAVLLGRVRRVQVSPAETRSHHSRPPQSRSGGGPSADPGTDTRG